jgi:hypothetical protein
LRFDSPTIPLQNSSLRFDLAPHNSTPKPNLLFFSFFFFFFFCFTQFRLKSIYSSTKYHQTKQPPGAHSSTRNTKLFNLSGRTASVRPSKKSTSQQRPPRPSLPRLRSDAPNPLSPPTNKNGRKAAAFLEFRRGTGTSWSGPTSPGPIYPASPSPHGFGRGEVWDFLINRRKRPPGSNPTPPMGFDSVSEGPVPNQGTGMDGIFLFLLLRVGGEIDEQ